MIRRRPSLEAGGERSVPELAAISLFSGAGGLDLGVERAGYRVLAAVEYEADAGATLRANFPHTNLLERDIRTVETSELLEAAELVAGEAELLIGGPPCTPFSKSGNWLEYKRTGKDANANLLNHYVRVLAETKPRSFLLENVFGLAYRNHNAFWLRRLLSTFRELDYNVDYRVLLAADYGVPQRRQRLFILGSRDGVPSFPEPTHSGPHETRHWDEALPRRVTSDDAIGDLDGRDDLSEPEEAVNGTFAHLLPQVPPGDNYLHFTAKRGHPKPLFEWRSRYWNFLLKLHPEQPSPTIQAQPGPWVGPFHWQNRRLRLAEIKRLQTFPDDYAIIGSRRSAQIQIGNAVPPLLAEQLGASLAAKALGTQAAALTA
jgi:DNA (cytosine-5)-methyltransferase 1